MKQELLMAAQMLDLARSQFSNHICNDYELDNTPENLAFVQRMIADGDYPEDTPNIHGDKILVMDWMVMSYCSSILRGMTEKTTMMYETLAELKAAYETGELDEDNSPLILDNDCSVVYVDKECVYRGGMPEDTLREALVLLNIPFRNA